VSTSFGGSSELLNQVEQGAPADVFASANETKMDSAVQEDLVNTPQVIARNRPMLIVPTDNPAGIRGLEDLAKPGMKLVLAQEGVPITEYAEDILARVALGEAGATFVYVTDVTPDIADQVGVIEIPENLNVIATYPIATLTQASNPELAQRWVDFVLSAEGQDVLEEYGFQRTS
jgi:molybdate transport system substrate-binding protein